MLWDPKDEVYQNSSNSDGVGCNPLGDLTRNHTVTIDRGTADGVLGVPMVAQHWSILTIAR